MQTVLVTGANRGIGLALVRELLKQEYQVVGGVRYPGTADALRELERDRARLLVVPLDVNDMESIESAAGAVSERFGKLEVLVNNAGVFPEEGYERFEDLDLNGFAAAFETNVVGVARVCRAFLPLLRRGTNGRIVNISSGAGSISTKEDSHYYCYSVSKAALNMLTRAMANELRGEGLSVVALSPGWVRTEMGGPKAPLSPEESARSIAAAIGGLSLKESGRFVDRHGKEGEYRW